MWKEYSADSTVLGRIGTVSSASFLLAGAIFWVKYCIVTSNLICVITEISVGGTGGFV